MILRRVAAAVLARDWATVIIEVSIVVLGVFLGLQTQQWVAERQRSELEAEYVARLHDEVADLQALREPIVAFRERRAESLQKTVSLVFSLEDGELPRDGCRDLAFSSVVTNPTDDLATLLELQASGGLAQFRNEALLESLRDFLLTRARSRDSRDGIERVMHDLFDRHPQLIQIESPAALLDSELIATTLNIFRCDLEAMRTSTTFRNQVEWNRLVLHQHLEDNALVDASLAELHRVLDQILGLEHNAPSNG